MTTEQPGRTFQTSWYLKVAPLSFGELFGARVDVTLLCRWCHERLWGETITGVVDILNLDGITRVHQCTNGGILNDQPV